MKTGDGRRRSVLSGEVSVRGLFLRAPQPPHGNRRGCRNVPSKFPLLVLILCVAAALWTLDGAQLARIEGPDPGESKALGPDESSHGALPGLPAAIPPAPAAENEAADGDSVLAYADAAGEPVALPPAGSAPRSSAEAPGRSGDAIEPPPDDDDFSLSGRVLTQAGEPVADMVVIAVSAREGEVRMFSDARGFYAFWNLLDERYEVRVEDNERYQGAKISVRVGVHSADLIVAELQQVGVYGVVKSVYGEPLEGVRVFQSDRQTQNAFSNKNGKYQFPLTAVLDKRAHSLGFQRQEYRAQYVRLGEADWEGHGDVRRDVELEPIGAVTEVSGTMVSSEGRPVSGERVQLHSPQLKRSYLAASDERGDFLFPEVESSGDYALIIRPEGPYQYYTQTGIQVTTSTPDLKIELQPNGLGSVAGEMLDAEGNPIPGFSLSLRSQSAGRGALPVTGDGQGRFAVDEVPAGELVFESRAYPYFTVRGLRLEPDAEKEVQLLLDWGSHRLLGQVRGRQGRPVPGSQVQLSMDHRENGMHSRSLRTAVADAKGRFIFTRLGAGSHTLRVNAPGSQVVSLDHRVGAGSENVRVQID